MLVHLNKTHENPNVAGYMSGQSLSPTLLSRFRGVELDKGPENFSCEESVEVVMVVEVVIVVGDGSRSDTLEVVGSRSDGNRSDGNRSGNRSGG